MVLAHLTQRLIPTPGVRGSNSAMSIFTGYIVLYILNKEKSCLIKSVTNLS